MIHRYLLEHFALSDRTILAMEEDFRRNCNGFAHDFKPTLDHRSFLHAQKRDVLVVFASDELCEVPVRIPELRRVAGSCEIWLLDAEERSPDAAVLEQLPSDFGFLRLADFLENGRPEVGRMVMVAECRSEKSFRRVEPLKFLLREEDALLVVDAAGSLSEMPGMARSRKGFQEEFEACLNGTRKGSDRRSILCFSLADNEKRSMR